MRGARRYTYRDSFGRRLFVAERCRKFDGVRFVYRHRMRRREIRRGLIKAAVGVGMMCASVVVLVVPPMQYSIALFMALILCGAVVFTNGIADVNDSGV